MKLGSFKAILLSLFAFSLFGCGDASDSSSLYGDTKPAGAWHLKSVDGADVENAESFDLYIAEAGFQLPFENLSTKLVAALMEDRLKKYPGSGEAFLHYPADSYPAILLSALNEHGGLDFEVSDDQGELSLSYAGSTFIFTAK